MNLQFYREPWWSVETRDLAMRMPQLKPKIESYWLWEAVIRVYFKFYANKD